MGVASGRRQPERGWRAMSAASHAPGEAAAQKVFICYRREESAAHAGRLYDAMVSRFGEENVFMDVDLPPGVDFEKRITEVVSSCVALLVVMGPSWATATEEDGTRRIDDPADFVRLEVETGLQRPEVTPIPVLVGGARMPRRESLPEKLRPIARRNAIEMSDGRWGYDVGRLMAALDKLLPAREGDKRAVPPPIEPAPPGWWLALEGALVGGLAGLVGRRLAETILHFKEAEDGEGWEQTAGHIASELARRTGTLALVGAVVAVWMALRIRRIDPLSPLFRGLAIGAVAGVVGGLLWTLPVYIPAEKAGFEGRALIELGALAVSGGLFGSLIGSLWQPRRKRGAFVAGALGGLLFAAIVLALEWKTKEDGERVIATGLAVASITGLTLAAMLALDWGEARERQAAAGSPRSG